MEIRLNDDSVEISAYINTTEKYSKVLRDSYGCFRERVAEGTFDKSLKSGNTVDLMLNHRRKISDTDNGVELYEDNIGLKCRAVLDDEEIVREARNGNLNQCSFGFCVNPDGDSWEIGENGMRLRTLRDITLFEVSLLTVEAAYASTAIDVRSERLNEYRTFDIEEREEEPVEEPVEPETEEEPEQEEETEDNSKIERSYDYLRAIIKTFE